MANSSDSLRPRTFFINEQHELVRGEKSGGGRVPQYQSINWAEKATRITETLSATKKKVSASPDPLKNSRYFLLANPTPELTKISKDKRHPHGKKVEKTEYAGAHSRIFRRLGIDLLSVAPDGSATVHTTPDKIEQLLLTAQSLPNTGLKEQSRWATIDSFDIIPEQYRVSKAWLETLSGNALTETIIELQPLLTKVEIDEVIRAISVFLLAPELKGKLLGTGADFSGRQWFRGMISLQSIRALARNFFSIEAIHAPLKTELALAAPRDRPRADAGRRDAAQRAPEAAAPNIAAMPSVGVVDLGVPPEHRYLGPYRRGEFIAPDSIGQMGDHGSHVTSRVVFGDFNFGGGLAEPPPGACRFVDVTVTRDLEHVEDKSIVPSMLGTLAAFRDTRVFNLSFGNFTPMDQLDPFEKKEKLALLRDLDNFIFANDVVVVIAAGNSFPGTVPQPPYPDHLETPEWALGTWAMSYNGLTCGAYVGRITAGGLVRSVGWPSPFSRIGPDLRGAYIPAFGEHGGNTDAQYRFAPGLGVWCCSADGNWEDHVGTSLAAPLLAREAAFAFQILQDYCEQGGRPFAALVKAFLALTATPTNNDARVQNLSARTLGRGKASVARLRQVSPDSAVFLWQGVLDAPDDVARVQIPIPQVWLTEANKPALRLIWVWDTPVHDAVKEWGCRQVTARLRPGPDADALTGTRQSYAGYPMVDRLYNLQAENLKEKKVKVEGDTWLLEISYEQTAEYYPSIEFPPQQRIAFVAELCDLDADSESPQGAIQALPVSSTLVRLSIPANRVPNPITIKIRR